MNSVSVSRSYYVAIAEAAAQHQGERSGRRIVRGSPFVAPGDFLGTILCETWLVDAELVGVMGAAYVAALWAYCEQHGVTPPSLDEVLATLPLLLVDARFPSVEIAELTQALQDQVPEMLPQS